MTARTRQVLLDRDEVVRRERRLKTSVTMSACGTHRRPISGSGTRPSPSEVHFRGFAGRRLGDAHRDALSRVVRAPREEWERGLRQHRSALLGEALADRAAVAVAFAPRSVAHRAARAASR